MRVGGRIGVCGASTSVDCNDNFAGVVDGVADDASYFVMRFKM
jgi:hypothetical protein